MAKYLLDTHTIIWYLNGNNKLSPEALTLIEDVSHGMFVSIASYWEMGIKIGIDKLTLPIPLTGFISLAKNKNIQTLPISEEAIIKMSKLGTHHKDPFDRILIAESIVSEITIISKDSQFDAYGISRVW